MCVRVCVDVCVSVCMYVRECVYTLTLGLGRSAARI